MSPPLPTTDYDSLAKQLGIDLSPSQGAPDITSILDRMRGAESGQETGGRNITNPDSGATGEFQVMPANIPSWTREHLGKALSVDQFKRDPEAQRQVFNGQMGKYLNQAFQDSPDEDTAIRKAASAWYSGKMNKYDDPAPQYSNGRKYPSIRDYTTKVLNRSKQFQSPQTDYDALSQQLFSGDESQPNTTDQTDYEALSKHLGLEDAQTPPPVPEHPDTIAAQAQAAADPTVKGRAAVLTTDPSQNDVFGNAPGFTAFPTKDGTLWVNTDKAKKVLKLKSQQDIQTFLDKNPDAMTRLIGKVDNVGNQTNQGMAVQTTDPATGKELSSSIVTSPESAQKQADVDQESFPGATSQVMPAQQVVANRIAGLQGGQPIDPSLAPVADELGNSLPVLPEQLAQSTNIAPLTDIGNAAAQGQRYAPTVPPTTPVQPPAAVQGQRGAGTPTQTAGNGVVQLQQSQTAVSVPDMPQTPGTSTDVKIGDDVNQNFTRSVGFQNKPADVSNKDWFVNQLVPQLASEMPTVGAEDIEKALRNSDFETPGKGLDKGYTPLSEIDKDHHFDFEMTPGFAAKAQQYHDERVGSATAKIQEAIATGGNTDDAAKQATALGLSGDEIDNITTDPGFLAQTMKLKQTYEGHLQSLGDTPNADVLARMLTGFTSKADATKEIDTRTKEAAAQKEAEDAAGFSDPEYLASHAQAYQQWKQGILAEHGSFTNLQKQVADSKGAYDYRPLAPALNATGLAALFGTGKDYASDLDAEEVYKKHNELSDVEQNNARNFGAGIKKYLGNTDNQSTVGFATTAGSDLMDMAAGAMRYATPAINWATDGKGASWLNRAAAQTRLIGEASRPDEGTLGSYSRMGGETLGSLPGIVGTTVLAGGNPVVGFALHSLLANSEKPWYKQTQGVIKDAALGAVFEAGPILDEIGGTLAKQVTEKLGLEAGSTGEKIISTLAEKGTPIGFLSTVGGTQAALEGQDTKSVVKNAVTMGLLGLATSAFGHAPSDAELDTMDGKVFRVPDENNNPVDVLVQKTPEGHQVIDITGQVPDGVQQAIVAPKEALGKEFASKPTAEQKAADTTSNEQTSGNQAEQPQTETPSIQAPQSDAVKEIEGQRQAELQQAQKDAIQLPLIDTATKVGQMRLKTPINAEDSEGGVVEGGSTVGAAQREITKRQKVLSTLLECLHGS